MLNVIDEFTHECLAIRVSRRLKSIDVIDALSDLFILRGVPGHVRIFFGAKRGRARARNLKPDRVRELARQAARERWRRSAFMSE